MPLEPGTRLGQFSIQTLIGKGGMGEVYRATDTELRRDVALKVLPDQFNLNSERVARFRRESELLATLNHPNIASIYGIYREGSRSSLVMEMVEGETLADRIKRDEAVPIEESLYIATQIAEALKHAHERGNIHRDLKPANVKITPDGRINLRPLYTLSRWRVN